MEKKFIHLCFLLSLVTTLSIFAQSEPILTTIAISSITQTSAVSGGNITSDGGFTVTARGVCWSISPNPTADLITKTIDGTGTGSFESTITGLSTGTTYYLRAYATNSVGTSYGNEISFKTYNSYAITDIDGNYYNTVTIGSQVWMAENLKTTKYRNGDLIGTTNPATLDISLEELPKYQWAYDGNESYVATYGRLYTPFTCWDNRRVCPTGWHVSTIEDWQNMSLMLDPSSLPWPSRDNEISSVVGGLLKEEGTGHWLTPNVGATNEVGFTALPGGIRRGNGTFGGVGNYGDWTTNSSHGYSTSYMESGLTAFDLYPDGSYPEEYNNQGFSIRCVNDIYAPNVATTEVTNIIQISAQSGGNITSDGGSAVTARGICWSTSENPTVDLSTKTSDGSGTGEFTSTISGLTAGTTYHVRAYASNSIATGYGEDLLFATAEHFGAVWWPGNGLDHMNLYVLTATLDGTALQPGDEIGVFDGDLCVGVGVLTEVLTGSNYLQCIVSLDDSSTPGKDGYTTGYPITFKVWDTSANIEGGYVQAEYTLGEGIFTPGGTATFNLTALYMVEQQINLLANWNILSFAVQPLNTSMMTIVDPLINAGTLIKVQDEKGNAIEELPDPIGWIDYIGQMSVTEGYKIKVSENSVLNITGQPITFPYDIPFDAGWNIMGAPALSSQDALELFDPLITAGSLIKVQDEKGNAIEKLPDPIGWIDNIHTIEPGKGYKVKTSVSTTLTINSSGKMESENIEKPTVQPSHFIPVYNGNGLDHMNIYIDKPTVDGVDLKTGDEIGVFDGSYCAGTVVVDDPSYEYLLINVSCDDPTTREIDGFTEGNAFELRLWDTQTRLEKKTQSLEVFKGYTNRFEKLGTSILKVDFEVISNSFLGDAYPNPSTGKTTFTFQHMSECRVHLEIFDIMGNLIKILVNQDMPAGTHKIEWDNSSASGNEVPSGVYFYRIRMNSFTQTKQLIVN